MGRMLATPDEYDKQSIHSSMHPYVNSFTTCFAIKYTHAGQKMLMYNVDKSNRKCSVAITHRQNKITEAGNPRIKDG